MSELIILTTHAIQYQAPLFQYLVKEAGINLFVVFLEPPAVDKPYWDNDFSTFIRWDIPLVEGYKWSVLPPGNLAQRLFSFFTLHARCGRPPIMLTSWSTPLHWVIWTWAILSRVPILVGAETNRESYALGRRPIWRHLWLRSLIKHTNALLYIGERNRDFYLWMGATSSRLFHYPYSIDNARFAETQKQALSQRNKRLAALGLQPDLPTLLFCGKLIPKKRPDLLLDVVYESGLTQDVNLLFVGGGRLRNQLVAKAAELNLARVALVGFLNQSEMPIAYALGDMLCLFSNTPAETWGLVVNEALACGRPVIVSDCCGCVPDLVLNKGSGWVVPPGDLAKATHIVKTAVNQFQLWSVMGEQGRLIVKRHTFAKMAEGLIAALNSVHRI